MRSFSEYRLRVNERITAPNVRVIDADKRMLGVLLRAEALRVAEEQKLDLVEVGPQSNPPLCKIFDFAEYSKRFPEMIREVEFSAFVEHHKEVRAGSEIDKGWCVLIFQRPDRLIARSDYMNEEEARALATKLMAQFRK